MPIPPLCTAGKENRIQRWEHEAVLDEIERRFEVMPEAMAVRRFTAEHVFGTIKGWMGAPSSERGGSRTLPQKPVWQCSTAASSAPSPLPALPPPSKR